MYDRKKRGKQEMVIMRNAFFVPIIVLETNRNICGSHHCCWWSQSQTKKEEKERAGYGKVNFQFSNKSNKYPEDRGGSCSARKVLKSVGAVGYGGL